LFTELPRRVPSGVALDVVLLVELGGSTDVVAARVALINDVVKNLDHANVKTAMVGYRDHFGPYLRGTDVRRRRLVVGCGLEDVDEVRRVLARRDQWQAVPVSNDNAAPLEDALDWIAQPDWGWRPHARHLLVVFGGRPPHPESVDDYGDARAAPCPYGLSWHDTLDTLRREHAVECIAVLHAEAVHNTSDDDAERAWRALGANGLYFIETSSAASLVRAFGFADPDKAPRLHLAVRAAGDANIAREGS